MSWQETYWRNPALMVVGIARKRVRREAHFMDLIQAGNIGLLRAAEKFDPSMGFRFNTYAGWWILQGVQRYLKQEDTLLHRSLLARHDCPDAISMESFPRGELAGALAQNGNQLDAMVEREQFQRKITVVRDRIKRLPAAQRRAFRVWLRGESLRKHAIQEGHSHVYAGKLKRLALEKVTASLRKKFRVDDGHTD
jgi:RNA polymerase sigma factor (sigma-70 family)